MTSLANTNKIPLILIIIMIILEIAGEFSFNVLCYDRSAIQEGQLWRLLSGNFIHLSWSHLGINLAGLILIWMFVGAWMTIRAAWLTIIFSALVVGLGLLLLNPDVLRYAGISGILHSLWLAGALFGAYSGHWEAYAMIMLLVLKLFCEQIFGPLSTSIYLAGGSVVVNAHLYGAISGFLIGVLLRDKH